jgi:magnesium-transporting ATPase (P-type)
MSGERDPRCYVSGLHRADVAAPALRPFVAISVAGYSARMPDLQSAEATDWHALAPDAALAGLDSRVAGLSAAEAEARLALHGSNRLPEGPRRSALRRLMAQFNNVLIYVLLGAGVLTLMFEHVLDAMVIFGVVLINAAVGFIQEGRAETALAAIRSLIDPRCTVLRDGRRQSLPAEALVPGDIVLLDAGDRVPADLRLLRAHALRIDESLLTGESVAAEKQSSAVAATAVLGDRLSMAYSGTLVATGSGQGLVIATGARTELGRISTLLGSVQTLTTPLLERMNLFAHQLTAVILALSVVVLLLAVWLHGNPWDQAFLAVVGLAVAAIPEGLPAVMTITLAIGVQRMAARRAIVRQLPAVETLGSVTVVCSDKTGTLTRNQMSVERLELAIARARVEGVGYAPVGAVHWAEGTASPQLALRAARVALLCNDAELEASGADDWRVLGDPMEGALLAFASRAGLDAAAEQAAHPRSDALPFNSAQLYMATRHRVHGADIALVKGAPERVLHLCDRVAVEDGEQALDVEGWHSRIVAMANDGLRVLALAECALDDADTLSHATLDGRCRLLGLLGLIDPPREEAIVAVAECRSAGMRVKMITGDHAATALAIARELHLVDAPQVLTGAELDALDADAFAAAASATDVFARVTPEHKLRLVEALQARGEVVAMTGDGVNDAPALKRADVGVAMGQKGTETAKQAAEMVLADDNFASIVAAVREGRVIYDNLRKVIAWTLPTNGGEMLAIMVALLFGLALPVTAVQILWINMICTVALGLTLAFEPAEPGVMQRPPRGRGAPLLSGFLVWRVVFVSLLFVTAAFGVFFASQHVGHSLELSRTLVVNTIVVLEIFYLFSVRYGDTTSLTLRGMRGTRAVLIGVGVTVLAQLAFTYLPPMQALFATEPVPLFAGLGVIATGVALLLVIEVEKALFRRFGRRTPGEMAAA